MTRDDIHDLLMDLGFAKDMVGDTWRRTFAVGAELCVDCANGKFLYEDADARGAHRRIPRRREQRGGFGTVRFNTEAQR